MAVIEFWRDITVGTPDDTVDRYRYDTSDDSVIHDTFLSQSGVLGPIHPAFGTVMYQECDELDLIQYKSIGSNLGLNKVTIADSPTCCQIEAIDFSVVRTNNTSLVTPNGTIVVTSTIEDINDYEASIDGGANFVGALDDAITFEDLPAGDYSIIIRAVGSICSVTTSISIVDNITYPPLIAHEETLPDLYSAIFHPITLGYKLDNNQATVKEDMSGVYLEVLSQDAKDYLGSLPIIKILDNEDYEGVYQVASTDDPGDPTKFYLEKKDGTIPTFTTEQAILFVPYDRQVFQLFCERTFNNYQKIADITVYPDAAGEYKLRLEGFLQGAFEVLPPIDYGDEITLLRKYYVTPRDFDMETAPTHFNAVYSAVEDLTPFLDELVPLGPAPINFINELTQKGLPVLFSYIDLTTARIRNITSSAQTDIVATTPEVLIFGIPLNQYDFTWINPAGVIGPLTITPDLPDWITLEPSAADTVKLHINAFTEDPGGGDYEPLDYNSNDYLTFGINAIVGCYEFAFSSGATPLFTLRICIFPIQKSDSVICDDPETVFNIAWINREGGWSSYVFEGKKIYGVDIGETKTYKKNGQLRRSTVEEVYQTAEVAINNKSIRDMRFIASLQMSVQAYLFDSATGQFSIPIILDRRNFDTFTKPFRQIEQQDKFSFKYATELVIQNQ